LAGLHRQPGPRILRSPARRLMGGGAAGVPRRSRHRAVVPPVPPVAAAELRELGLRRCARCGWRRSPVRSTGSDRALVRVWCPCERAIVCLGCGQVDLDHWLGPWYVDESRGRRCTRCSWYPLGRMAVVPRDSRGPRRMSRSPARVLEADPSTVFHGLRRPRCTQARVQTSSRTCA